MDKANIFYISPDEMIHYCTIVLLHKLLRNHFKCDSLKASDFCPPNAKCQMPSLVNVTQKITLKIRHPKTHFHFFSDN